MIKSIKACDSNEIFNAKIQWFKNNLHARDNNIVVLDNKVISCFFDCKVIRDNNNNFGIKFYNLNEIFLLINLYPELTEIIDLNYLNSLSNFNISNKGNVSNQIFVSKHDSSNELIPNCFLNATDSYIDLQNNDVVDNNLEVTNSNETKLETVIKSFKPYKCDSFRVLDTIDLNENRALNFRKRVCKSHTGDIWIKVAIWNLQSLNIKISQRYVKIEFIRDFFNNNKFDILWLIDVNDVETIILNGFKKYTDNRNVLFIRDNLELEFTISKNLIFDDFSKLAFIYVTPASDDIILKQNFITLIKSQYSIFGDINLKSNKDLNKYVTHFAGEDSLQTGVISKKTAKVYTFAAPSDHNLILCEIKAKCKFNCSLRISSIGIENAKTNINRILDGKIPDFKPIVKIKQTYFGLNDRENTLNQMINEYLKNNVSKIYKRYNYLWKYDRREPFLGKKVCDGVKTTYETHLRANKDKIYFDCEKMILSESVYKYLQVKVSKSKAINDDFVTLRDICEATNVKLLNENTNRNLILNNIIDVINKLKKVLNAETFFLQKNKTVATFSDVRVIIIIPTLVKIYESLTYNIIAEYISKFFNNKQNKYQYGAIKGGSTYNAMIDVRLKMEKFGAKGVIFLDISKGYDNIDFNILNMAINQIDNNDIRQILLNWSKMVYNVDVVVNDDKIKRTRGVPMGLSFSPMLFILYVDYVLQNVDKANLVMYIDDLAIILKNDNSAHDNLDNVLSIIEKFENAYLTINKKKTVLLTSDNNLKGVFGEFFPIVNSEKYLGRLIGLNGDGIIKNDDRFFNMKAFRCAAFPYWSHFFVKRLIGISALDAKIRFRFMMWSTDNPHIRTSLWRNSWFYYKKGMGVYSYTQLSFSTFNIFRYFIDPNDILNWSVKLEQGIPKNIIITEIKQKLKVIVKDINDHGMAMINKAIDDIDIRIDFGFKAKEDPFNFNNLFLKQLWRDFKANMLKQYIDEKSKAKIEIYNNIRKITNSKIFNHSAIIQRIAFRHLFLSKKQKKKQLFEILVLQKLSTELDTKLKAKEDVNTDNCFICDNEDYIDSILNKNDEEFVNYCTSEYKKLWKFLDNLMNLYDMSKLKIDNSTEIENSIALYDHVFYVDGSCVKSIKDKNFGDVGYGIYYKNNKTLAEQTIANKVIDINFKNLQNVGGELFGALEAAKFAIKNNLDKILICYDFLGIEKYALGQWHSNETGILEYIYNMQLLRRKVNIEFLKIPAHTGIYGNELADKLSKSAVGIKKDENPLKENVNGITKELHDYFNNNYHTIFKVLVILEMIILNNNLNDLNIPELFFTIKIKMANMDDFLNKNVHLLDYSDLDPLDINFNDILTI